MKEAVDAAVGRILKTPEYLDIVSKPLDAATKGQIDKIERMWPRILKMETDRVMLNKEEAQPVLSSARQTFENVSQSVSNFFGR